MIKVKLIKLITNDVTGYSLISFELGRQLKHHSYTGYVSILPIAFVAEARYTEIERCLDRKELLHNGPIKISFLVFYANQRLHGVVSKVCVRKPGILDAPLKTARKPRWSGMTTYIKCCYNQGLSQHARLHGVTGSPCPCSQGNPQTTWIWLWLAATVLLDFGSVFRAYLSI